MNPHTGAFLDDDIGLGIGVGSDVPIFSPLITTLRNLYGGDDAAATIRNSTAMVKVFDAVAGSILKVAQINEHRANGHRRVENFLLFPEDISQAIYVKGQCTISGIDTIVPDGGSTDVNVVQTYDFNTDIEGRVYVLRVKARAVSGAFNPKLVVDGRTSGGAFISQSLVTLNLTTEDRIYTVEYTAPATAEQIRVRIGGNTSWAEADGNVVATKFQLEDVTGLDNQNPSEFVPNDTAIGTAIADDDMSVDDAASWVTDASATIVFNTDHYDYSNTVASHAVWLPNRVFEIGRKYVYSVEIKDGTAASKTCNYRHTDDGGTTQSPSFVSTAAWVQHQWTKVADGNATTGQSGFRITDSLSGDTIQFRNFTVYEASTGRQVFTSTNGNTVASNVVTEADGDPLFPTKSIDGARYNDTKPDYATAIVVAAGGEMNDAGKWYRTALGGTTNGATLLTDVGVTDWVEMGWHSNIYGLLIEPIATNLYPSPEAVITRTFAIAAGDNTLSVKGSGSILTSDGTATCSGHGTASEGTDVTINCTVPGTVVCTLTGSLDTAQMEAGSVSTSFTPSTRATEAGTIEHSIFGNFNNAAGVYAADVIFASDKAASAAIRSITGVDAVGSFLYQNIAGGAIDSTDGTNTATNTTAYVAGKVYGLRKRWNAVTGKQQIGIHDLTTYGATTQWGAEATYDGAHTLGTLIEQAIGIIEPLTYRNLPTIYNRDMTIAQIEAKF